MRRYGQVIGIKPARLEEYRKYHANAWPEIVAKLSECNVTNFSIFHKDDTLFSYFEYVGHDYAADMQKMRAHPKTQEWLKIMDDMQVPLPTRKPGEWWADMVEVFHMD